jgi:L-threonylcarbamoyladenylate synthase
MRAPWNPDVNADLAAAVDALARGEVVGLPTETVYGLAADAENPDAVRRIFALKGRPADHPVIVHVPDARGLERYGRDVPDSARRLAAAFWPGPLTLIVRRAPRVPDVVTGGQDTVGLRSPAHPVAQAVLAAFGRGLAAPSANRFGHVSPTTAAHVRAEFGERVPIVLDGGKCAVGIESTIVDLSGARPRILRPGMLDRARLEAVIGPIDTGPAGDAPRVSGSLESHYAPETPVAVLERAALLDCQARLARRGLVARALALGALPAGLHGVALPAEPRGYAHGLYAALRTLDALGADAILVEAVPDAPGWEAIRDRLARASAGVGLDCYGP